MSNVTQANRTERASVYTSSLCCMFNCHDTTAAFCPVSLLRYKPAHESKYGERSLVYNVTGTHRTECCSGIVTVKHTTERASV